MKNKEIVDVFKNRGNNWFGEKNESDCFAGNIPANVKNDVRNNFGISFDEEILFVRDTGFWNSRDQGLVITDEAIYCIPDNDNPEQKTFIPWSSMSGVRFKDLLMNINANFEDGSSECPIHISYFVKSDDENTQSRVGNKIADLLNNALEVYKPAQDPDDAALDKYFELVEQGEDDDTLLSYALDAYQEFPEAKLFSYLIADLYFSKKENEKALDYINKGISQVEEGSRLFVYLTHLKYSIYEHILHDIPNARKICFMTSKYATDEEVYNIKIKDDSDSDFKKYEKAFSDLFLSLPYNDRKVLMPVREYVDMSQTYITVIDIKNLPSINFPIGHPVANQLYIGHPFLPQKYLPFENYQLELIEDKVREFCQIAQSLGAIEISIETENSSQSNSSRIYNTNIDGGIDYKMSSIKGGFRREGSRNLIEEISQAINLHQIFTPTKKPCLPENTVWYQNEPSWKRLYEQRMNGGLTQHEERIETRKSQMVDNHELQEIKAELQHLFAEANLNWNSTLEEKFSQQENAVLSIKVRFAPIESLGQLSNGSTKNSSINNAFSIKEQEYLTSLKEFLEDDTELSPRERKMLDRIRQSLGISEERAAELEASLAPQLTEDEQEYLEMYHEYAEKGEISEKERRRLDKFAAALGISDERKREIE